MLNTSNQSNDIGITSNKDSNSMRILFLYIYLTQLCFIDDTIFYIGPKID